MELSPWFLHRQIYKIPLLCLVVGAVVFSVLEWVKLFSKLVVILIIKGYTVAFNSNFYKAFTILFRWLTDVGGGGGLIYV